MARWTLVHIPCGRHVKAGGVGVAGKYGAELLRVCGLETLQHGALRGGIRIGNPGDITAARALPAPGPSGLAAGGPGRLAPVWPLHGGAAVLVHEQCCDALLHVQRGRVGGMNVAQVGLKLGWPAVRAISAPNDSSREAEMGAGSGRQPRSWSAVPVPAAGGGGAAVSRPAGPGGTCPARKRLSPIHRGKPAQIVQEALTPHQGTGKARHRRRAAEPQAAAGFRNGDAQKPSRCGHVMLVEGPLQDGPHSPPKTDQARDAAEGQGVERRA